LRAFIATEDEFTVARVLRRLWEYREIIPLYQSTFWGRLRAAVLFRARMRLIASNGMRR
jgi:hypothetical protein